MSSVAVNDTTVPHFKNITLSVSKGDQETVILGVLTDSNTVNIELKQKKHVFKSVYIY